jgi:hypothetical protein
VFSGNPLRVKQRQFASPNRNPKLGMKDSSWRIRRIDLKLNCCILRISRSRQQGGTKRHTRKVKGFHTSGFGLVKECLLKLPPLCKDGGSRLEN